MATKTDKYELRKKEDNDFYNIDDFNDNMDKIETALTEFDDSGSADGITSFTDMLTKLVTGNKLAVTLRNLKAGLQFVLHAGSIVNNCVTDNAKLPLSAAQGKALQDAITKLNGDLSFNYLYGYVASDLKLSDYPKDTRNIIPLEASDNSLGNLIELSDDKKWIVFKRNGRVRFNGCLSISWNNDFYLQVSVCRESNDSKGTPVPVVGVSIRSPLKQGNTFVYVDRVLRVKEGERLCFAFIIPNWCDTTGGFISRNSDRASSGLMANYVSFNDEMYV